MSCLNDLCESTATCCRVKSYMPKDVDVYRNYVRTNDCIGFISNIDRAAMSSFYANVSYAFQNLEYIFRDVLQEGSSRGVHVSVWTHYIKTYYTTSFSIIESMLEAALVKNGNIDVERVTDPSNRSPQAGYIINTSQSSGVISQGLRDNLQLFREKRNKVHLSKILETSGETSFEEYDWRAFNLGDMAFASKCLLDLLVEISERDKSDGELNSIFDFLYEAEVAE